MRGNRTPFTRSQALRSGVKKKPGNNPGFYLIYRGFPYHASCPHALQIKEMPSSESVQTLWKIPGLM